MYVAHKPYYVRAVVELVRLCYCRRVDEPFRLFAACLCFFFSFHARKTGLEIINFRNEKSLVVV